jgi:hypothetical protein
MNNPFPLTRLAIALPFESVPFPAIFESGPLTMRQNCRTTVSAVPENVQGAEQLP